jgi:hypothetical protein
MISKALAAMKLNRGKTGLSFMRCSARADARLRVSGSASTRILAAALVVLHLSGCASLLGPSLPTPLPTEYMPTAIAKTLAAQGVEPLPTRSATPQLSPGAERMLSPTQTSRPAKATSTPRPTRTATASATPTATPTVTRTPTPNNTELAETSAYILSLTPPPGTQSPTPAPALPDAPVQIYRLGELSRVISPIDVTTRLTSGYGKVVRIELHGEDGRLLARYLKTFTFIPWETAKVGVSLEFEIRATAEAGRLVVSVEDKFGRLIDVNSVNLILLSTGETELNPATALLQRIIIQEPVPKALIQGGNVVVSGRALPNNPQQSLRVMLIAEDGRILGQRLAGVDIQIPGDYGFYKAEIPYLVTDLTPALLVVYEEGEPVSDIAHLSSIQVILAP